MVGKLLLTILFLTVVSLSKAEKENHENKLQSRNLYGFQNPGNYPSNFRQRACSYYLELGNEESQGRASVNIRSQSLSIDIRGAEPSTMYTVWVDFQNRATGALASDYPVTNNDVDIARTGPGIGRGVAPAFGVTAPVYEGMRPDVNAVITDRFGNGSLRVYLGYNLLGMGQSPVMAESLTMQGENRIGGSWLRRYPHPLALGANRQVRSRGVPDVVRATAQGLTIVGHFEPLSHGHTPGVGGVDHFPGFKGDFPWYCYN